MSTFSQTIIEGHVGGDPEMKYFEGGSCVCNFNLATKETWKDKQGEKKERTEWHRVVLRNKVAEIAEKYVKKGTKVLIVGLNRTRKYEKDGSTFYVTEVHGQTLRLMGRAADKDSTQSATEQYHASSGVADEDDLPF
jgi:single-strand DNA-binding protein